MACMDDPLGIQIGYLEGAYDILWAMSMQYEEMQHPNKAFQSLSAWIEELTDRIQGQLDPAIGIDKPRAVYIQKKIKEISMDKSGARPSDIIEQISKEGIPEDDL